MIVHSLLLALALQVGSQTPAIIDRVRLDRSQDVSFHAIALPETVFVGQAATYELGVFISDEMRQRLRKNPEFVPPELQSVLAYDLRDTHGSRTIVRDGRTYEVHVFRRALFPVAPGRIVIPAARLSYQVPLGSSFFSREETRLLTAEPVTIVAIPPPMAGRPASWNGAVGDLRLSTILGRGRIRVGDPFVVTLRLSGEGNVHLLPRPVWTVPWATIVPGGERVTIDTLAERVRGSKEFDWLVTPTVDGLLTVPAVSYPYFDPERREYRTTTSPAQSFRVDAGSLASIDTTTRAPAVSHPLPIRARWSRPLPDAPDRSLWFWAVLLLAPIPVLVQYLRGRPRVRSSLVPADPLRALAAANSNDAAAARAALRAAISARLGTSNIPWAEPGALRRCFRHHGITIGTVTDAMSVLGRIDAAAFGSTAGPVTGIAVAALAVFGAIDREARASTVGRAARRAPAAVIVAFFALGAARLLSAQIGVDPRTTFDQAVATYALGTRDKAADDFLSAARAAPAAAAAWANVGTASWMAADTALAVAGWQHALRLNPLDADTRARLTLAGGDAGAGQDIVWPVPRRVPAWTALLLWIAGWAALWRRRARRTAVGVLVLAALLLVVSHMQYARLTDRSVAVVAHPTALRALPALVAEANAAPLTGELVRVVERKGVWARVAASGGREGWIGADRLIDLDGRPLRDVP